MSLVLIPRHVDLDSGCRSSDLNPSPSTLPLGACAAPGASEEIPPVASGRHRPAALPGGPL